MKGYDKVKKAKVKAGILKGKSLKQSVKEAGYSINTAINAWRLGVVKCCIEEIEREFKTSDVTVDNVLKDIELGKELSLSTGDLPTYKGLVELKGKYLAMFKDKQIRETDFIPPPVFYNPSGVNRIENVS